MKNNNLNQLTNKHNGGIKKIKLRELLELNKDSIKNKTIKTMFPPIEIGSITLVDQVVLLLLNELVKPNKIIEVGTYLGYTTNLFLKNTSAQVYTIDLPKKSNINTYNSSKIYIDGEENDNYLRERYLNNNENYLSDLDEAESKRLTLIEKDSTTFSFVNEIGEVEFVFIDGGHSYDIVKSDTENARKSIRSGVIIWHDFNSTIHSDVTKYLKNQKERKIFYVIGSLCAFEVI